MENIILSVEGMSCDHCVKTVGTALREVEGVEEYEVNLDDASATLTVNPNKTNRDALINAINNTELFTAL